MVFSEHLSNRLYWDKSYLRLSLKWLSKSQLEELELLHNSNYMKEFISELYSGTFKWGQCHKVLINKSGTTKKRTVYMYSIRDRYILGALYSLFSDVYKDVISDSCFSYKSRTNAQTALDYLMSDEHLHDKYALKLDISAYFNSVSKEVLSEMLTEVASSDTHLFETLKDLYFTDEVFHKGEILSEFKSLIPGTSLSSFFANYCLKDIDNYVSDELGITYARYSDDIIYFTETEEERDRIRELIETKLSDVGLSINEKKYELFSPGDEITFLGLKFKHGVVDISDHSFRKFKRKIGNSCRRGRRVITQDKVNSEVVARRLLRKFNNRVFKSYVMDKSKYGWAYYAFRYINTLETLREIDFYHKDRLRQMITGQNNKGNVKKVSNEKLKELGYVSLCDMYLRFKTDFDYYCDVVDSL